MTNGGGIIQHTLSFILYDPIGRGASLIVGIVVTALVYEYFVMVQKEAQLVSKDELIRIKDERMKQINDQVEALKADLDFKPLRERRVLEGLKEKNDELARQNKALAQIAESVGDSIVHLPDAEAFARTVEKLKDENTDLIEKLGRYEARTIVSEMTVGKGDTWTGFGGRVVFGVKDLRVQGFAQTQFSVDGISKRRDLWPGDQIKFELDQQSYLLNIESVRFVLSRVVIGVSRLGK